MVFIFSFQYLMTFYNASILLCKNKRLFLIREGVWSGRGFLDCLLPTLIFFPKEEDFWLISLTLKKKKKKEWGPRKVKKTKSKKTYQKDNTFYCGKFQTDPSADKIFNWPQQWSTWLFLFHLPPPPIPPCTFSLSFLFIYVFIFVFLPSLGPLLQHMEVPRLGVESEL